MKILILTLSLILSSQLLAAPVYHDISKGQHHKGGELTIEVLDNTEESFNARIGYHIKKKLYVPVSDSKLKGSVEQSLPTLFSTIEGYQLLEKLGEIKVEKATVTFIKRESVGKYYDSFKIEIKPDNGRWKGFLWYHPSVDGVGWHKSELTLLSIPILGDYALKSSIR